MQGRLREKTLYPRLRRFLETNFDCKWVVSCKGSEDVGQLDVAGVRVFQERFSNRYEVIGVEVKPRTSHFGKKIGQTLGYSLLAHRVYLACKESFTVPQIELASRLGVGLIRINPKSGCEEVIGSRVFQPDKEKMLKLLIRMDLAECMLCGSIIDGKCSKNLQEAIKRKISFEFCRYFESRYTSYYKGKKKVFDQYLYICPNCARLFRDEELASEVNALQKKIEKLETRMKRR